jgi:hypothetical protein
MKPQGRKITLPEVFILKIQNTSDDKIYDLDIFHNFDNRILINSTDDDLSLFDFKKILQSKAITVDNLLIKTFFEYHDFVKKQVHCSLKIQNTETEKIFYLKTDPHQYDPSQVKVAERFYISDRTSMILQYLMPCMEMLIYFGLGKY